MSEWRPSIRCDVLDWHKPSKDLAVRAMGIGYEATCRRCGGSLLQDSWGQWFRLSPLQTTPAPSLSPRPALQPGTSATASTMRSQARP